MPQEPKGRSWGAVESQRGPCKVATRGFCLSLQKLMEIPLVGYGARREKKQRESNHQALN